MGKLDFQEVSTETFKSTVEQYFGERIGMNLLLNDSRKLRLEDVSCYKDFISLDKKVSSYSSFSHALKEILLEYTNYIDNEEHFDLEWE